MCHWNNELSMDIYKIEPSDFLDESIYVNLMEYYIDRQKFSTDIIAAKNLIKVLRKHLRTKVEAGKASRGKYYARYGTDPSTTTEVLAETMPLAVSRLALLALTKSV